MVEWDEFGLEGELVADNILVAVAWPYANGSLHLGQIAGAYLAPDIFVRYHRARGNRAIMVTGSFRCRSSCTTMPASEP